MDLLGCLGGGDGLQCVDRPVLQLRGQPGQRRQTAPNPAVDEDAQQPAQHQQGGQHVGDQLTRNPLLFRHALAHLHPQHLGDIAIAVVQIQGHHAQGAAIQGGGVVQGHASNGLLALGLG